MIYVDDNSIRISGVTLPGIYKGIEIVTDALVEEQEIQGSNKKPKQATGYEDAKVNIDIELYESAGITAEQKLQQIQNLFRPAGQAKPTVHQMVSSHASVRGVRQVILKSMTSKESNKNDKITVSLELWEYVPVTLTGSKSGKRSKTKETTNTTTNNLKAEYKSYLTSDRGSAPKQTAKTEESPAVDDRSARVSAMLTRRKRG